MQLISSRFSVQQRINLSFFILSVATVAYSFLKSNFIELNGQCGNDGLTYCSMAQGNIEFKPFSRRTFLPFLVGIISKSHIVTTFFILNSIFLVFTAVLIYLFQSKMNSQYNLLPVSLFLLNISTFRMLFAYPVLTDFLAIFLVVLFFYLYIFFRNSSKYIFLISILIILCFVRENLSVTLSASLIISDFLLKKIKIQNIIIFIISCVFTYISFRQPSSENYVHESNLFKVFLISIQGNFDNYETVFKLLYLTFVGLSPIALYSFFLLRKVNNNLIPLIIFSILILISQINLNLANPEPRLMLIPSVLMPFVFFAKTRNFRLIAILFIATFSYWDFRQFSNGKYESYLEMFGQPYLSFSFNYEQFVDRFLLFFGLLAIWTIFEVIILIKNKFFKKRSIRVN